MKIEVVTLFPRLIAGALEFGVVGRAIARGLLSVGTEDPRVHTSDVHRTIDDRPYGGGPGMVMKPEPLLAAIRAAQARVPVGSPRLYLSAQGERFGQAAAQELAKCPGMVLIAGRYEGVDERVIELGSDRELSVGDYVLSGGELPAARLAALHAAGNIRGQGGAGGTIVGRSRRYPPLAPRAGAGTHG